MMADSATSSNDTAITLSGERVVTRNIHCRWRWVSALICEVERENRSLSMVMPESFTW